MLPDNAKGAEYFAKGAESGDPQAYYNLGLCYEFGNGVEVDLKKAARLYKYASEHGIKMANLAIFRCVKQYEAEKNSD